MTEKEIQLLGFTKEDIIEYEEEENPDYYYAFDVVDGITFITQSKEDVKNDQWYVDFFNTNPIIRYHKMEEVQTLINKLTNAIVKDEK